MKPEILLKAYVQYQSEDAFRDLVVGTLDATYAAALRIVHGPPHLAEAVTVRVYLELARKAPSLDKDVVLAAWLHERTCKLAVAILHAEGRPVDRAALKKEKSPGSLPSSVQPAPAGLAIRICQGIFLTSARHTSVGFFPTGFRWPGWIRPRHAGGVAVCVLAFIVWWSNPFHRRNPIVESQGMQMTQMTPASFAQLASPQDGGPLTLNQMANTNAGINPIQK